MKKINFKFILIAFCAGLIFFMAVGEAFARSRGFGGFRSSRSFSSKKSYSSSSSTWGKSKSGLSNTGRKSSARKMSSADRAQYNKAKASGTVFNNKTDAVKSFQGKYASKYPTTFSSKPAVKPDYIPSTITANGKQHNISYNNGGYGYYAGSVWRPYSPFTDPLMLAGLMAMNGYYYGPRPGLSFMGILGMGITLFMLVVILKSVVSSLGQGKRKFNIVN